MNNTQVVERAYQHFFPDIRCPEMIERPSDAVGFSGTVVYRITHLGQRFCLKQFRKGLDITRQSAINSLIRNTASSGIKFVPAPYLDSQGNTLFEWADSVWQLEPWMPGIANFLQAPSVDRLRSIGVAVARWHLAAHQIAGYSTASFFSNVRLETAPTVLDRLRALMLILNSRLNSIEAAIMHDTNADWREAGMLITTHVRSAGPQLLNDLSAAQHWQVPLQPAIRDLWHDHLLFEDELLSGLIDFNAMRVDTVAADLSRLLGSLAGSLAKYDEVLLEAYESERKLSPNELRLIPVLDRANTMLSGMTWLQRRYIERMEMTDNPRVLTRLQKIAHRLTARVSIL